MIRIIAASCTIIASLSLTTLAVAEPYIAVKKGMKCIACHTNPTGGGKRNVYGNNFAQFEFATNDFSLLRGDNSTGASKVTDTNSKSNSWNGELGPYISMGGDLRSNINAEDIPNQSNKFEFELNEVLTYLEFRLIPNRLSFYIDERIAPNTATNRESYALLWLDDMRYYLKIGKFFLPYGLRLEDDFSYIRRYTGINYFNSDSGLEAGAELGEWSISFSITEGRAGDIGKRYSSILSLIRPEWRIGASANFDDVSPSSGANKRRMVNIFTGIKTGQISWLGEIDFISDDPTAGDKRIVFAEANLGYWHGHNYKFTFEYYEPDTNTSNDEQTRISTVWEYIPVQFIQTRIGLRRNRGITAVNTQNSNELFVQLHLFF